MRLYTRLALVLTPLGALLLATGGTQQHPKQLAFEPGSFKIDPKTGEFEQPHLDYDAGEDGEVLNLVFTDWMTNPAVRGTPYQYLCFDATEGSATSVGLKRLLIDRRYLPKGYKPRIPGVPVALFDRSTADLKSGEMCIRINQFVKHSDGSIKTEFLHSGYCIVGGAFVTYTAYKVKGSWKAELERWFDP